jgi:DNA gyrase/topoisomerase IV subunit A
MALSQISKPKKINPISKLEEESSESGYRLGFNKKKSESRY